jgi:hypothetical protein
MPILAALIVVIQLCFAYHAVKTGRPYWWLFIIMGFPAMGCVLYYFIEVFPTSRESRRAEQAMRAVSKALEGAGRLDEALAEFKVLAEAYPGEEGRFRYGALLKRMGRADAARDVFQRMLRNAQRTPGHYREAQREWLTLARENVQM